MIRFDEALAQLLAAVRPLPPVLARPESAAGLRLADALVARGALPGRDDAAMDGWAVRAADVAGASRETPVSLPEGRDAAPIATGDPIPAGFDAVLPLELARRGAGTIEVFRPVAAGTHIRRRGEDVAPGEVIAPAGAPVDPGVVAAACALEVPALPVHRRPRAAVVAVGRHVAEGRPDATGAAVAAALGAAAVEVHRRERFGGTDVSELDALAACLGELAELVDLVVTVGAASVGADDLVPGALARAGARLVFHGVSLKPGKPVGLALLGETPVLVLPGNPGAALAAFDLLGRPLVSRLAGDPGAGADLVPARLAAPLERKKGKAGLVRGTLVAAVDGLRFTPLVKQGSGQVSALVGGEALAIVAPEHERLPAGAPVPVRLLSIPGPAVAAAEPSRVFAVAGWSGAGKTHVVGALVRRLAERGLRVATVKHDVHGFEPDPPGKDTALHRAAGAVATVLVGPERTASIREGPGEALPAIAARLLAEGADLVLAEGFKDEPTVPKIEVVARGRPSPRARPVIARVVDGSAPLNAGEGPGAAARDGNPDARSDGPPEYWTDPADLARLADRLAAGVSGHLPRP